MEIGLNITGEVALLLKRSRKEVFILQALVNLVVVGKGSMHARPVQ